MDEKPSKKPDLIPREYSLIAVMVFCVAIAIFVLVWAQEPDYRPLVQDMTLVDAVKIVDILDQEDIQYRADIKIHILYVANEHEERARLSLARVGVVINYPNRLSYSTLPEACLLLEGKQIDKSELPIWEDPKFLPIIKLVMGGLVIIVLLLSVVRPALRALIYPDEEDK